MADAWSTTVTREPEFDDYTRSRVMALLAWEAGRCPKCGNYDTLVELRRDNRYVNWPQHGGRRFEVTAWRCTACGAADIVERDFTTKHAKDKPPAAGVFAPGDGRMYSARPITEED